MNARKATPWVVCLLVLAGMACAGLRYRAQRELQLTRGDSLWRLTYEVEFEADKTGAKLRAAFPYDTKRSRVFHQDVRYAGLRVERLRPSLLQARELLFVAIGPGAHTLTAKFDIHLSGRSRLRSREPEVNLTATARAEWLRGAPMIQADSPVVLETLRQLRRETPPSDDLMHRLFDHCVKVIERGDDTAPQDAVSVLQRKTATPLGRARALAALCRASKTPARLVTGFEVKEASSAEPHIWVEALINGHWEPFDPEHGFARELPHNFVAVRHDGGDVARVTDARDVRAKFSIVQLPSGPGTILSKHRNPLAILDLTRLPLEMHDVLTLVLLLPIGALVTALFRTIIGIRTFGTFTPSLIALSFVFADWRTGIFVFVVVLAIGLVSRSFLDRLRLLMVPRLSAVLTLVVLCIVFSVSLLDYWSLTPSAQAVLLPMVILTMTIERFYLASEEDSVQFALQLLAGTLLVGLCCYVVLHWAAAGRILFTYPELHLFTIAALVLIGRYTGYRLTELWRFRDIAPPNPPTT